MLTCSEPCKTFLMFTQNPYVKWCSTGCWWIATKGWFQYNDTTLPGKMVSIIETQPYSCVWCCVGWLPLLVTSNCDTRLTYHIPPLSTATHFTVIINVLIRIYLLTVWHRFHSLPKWHPHVSPFFTVLLDLGLMEGWRYVRYISV